MGVVDMHMKVVYRVSMSAVSGGGIIIVQVGWGEEWDKDTGRNVMLPHTDMTQSI